MAKVFQDDNVYDATSKRLDVVFSNFDKVYISFSGGKDSSLLLNLALQKAKEHNKLPLHVMFIDLEAQYEHTVTHIEEMMSLPGVKGYWICLPIHLRNAVSQTVPYWVCWDPDKKESWVRDMPDHPSVISDTSYFPFFKKGMEFEEFVSGFADWFSSNDTEETACMVGIRSDESLNRYGTIKRAKKQKFQDLSWSTQISDSVYNFYPIYDWRTHDIWVANGKYKFKYNKIYDLMYLACVPISSMRLCQPYGDSQRKGLYLFKILEPNTWERVVARVEGANFGNRYSKDKALGNRKVLLPPGHTYKSYSKFLLQTMPPHIAKHYRMKIFKFLNWHRKNAKKTGYSFIPDAADPKQETAKKAPSWRRICKVLLRNDYWCYGLSFGPTKRQHEKQLEAVLNIKHNPMES